MPLESPIAGDAGEHEPGRVGEDDADGLAFELFSEGPQHRERAAGEAGVELDIGLVGHLDPVGRDVQLLGPAPRGEDGVPHRLRCRCFLGEESLAALRDQLLGGRASEDGHAGRLFGARPHDRPPNVVFPAPTRYAVSTVECRSTDPASTVSY